MNSLTVVFSKSFLRCSPSNLIINDIVVVRLQNQNLQIRYVTLFTLKIFYLKMNVSFINTFAKFVSSLIDIITRLIPFIKNVYNSGYKFTSHLPSLRKDYIYIVLVSTVFKLCTFMLIFKLFYHIRSFFQCSCGCMKLKVLTWWILRKLLKPLNEIQSARFGKCDQIKKCTHM